MKKYIKTSKAIYYMEMPLKIGDASREDDFVIMENILYKQNTKGERLQSFGEIISVSTNLLDFIIPMETLIEHKPILEFEKYNFAQKIKDENVISSIGEIINSGDITALFSRNIHGDFIRYEVIIYEQVKTTNDL